MKIAKACKQCRGGKRKCTGSGETADAACLPCRKRNLACSKSSNLKYMSTRDLVPSISTSAAYSSPAAVETSLTPQEVYEFVGLYLRFVHDRPHSLFHEKSLWRNLQDGLVDQCLILAICAIGSRFSPNSRQRSAELASRSSALFSQQLDVISLSNVQTTIILANVYAAERNNALEALYFGIANRMAYLLRLHETNVHDLPVIREVKCRIWWSLFIADQWVPPALALPREVLTSSRMLDLPMDEVIFQELEATAPALVGGRVDGLWKHNSKLAEILGPIQDLNKSLLSQENEQANVNDQVERLEERLQDWYESIPPDRCMNDTNLDAHRAKGQGGTFVGLHLGYYHYTMLLYFQYLDTPPVSSPASCNFATKCRRNALLYSKLLHKARGKDDCHVVFLTVAHMTLVSSAVLLHMFLFGDEEEVEEARKHLVFNFEALIDLKKYWSHVDIVIQRLMTFQKACLTIPRAHRVDGWVVRFLLEHGLPFSDKPMDIENGDNLSPTHSLLPKDEVLADRSDMLDAVFTNWYKSDGRFVDEC